MTRKRTPIVDAVLELLAVDKLLEIREQWSEQQLQEFNATLYSVGLFFAITSLLMLLFLSFVLNIVSSSDGVFEFIESVLTNAGSFVIIVWLVSTYLVRVVNSAANSEVPFRIEHNRLDDTLEGYREKEWFQTVVDTVSISFAVLSVFVLHIYRTELLLDYPTISSLLDFPSMVLALLIFALDVGYLGLFLATISQIYDVAVRVIS